MIEDTSVPAPSHILAVWSKGKDTTAPRTVEIRPVHELLFAATCAHLPAFPAAARPTCEDGKTRLPVVPLCIPHLPTFGLLQHYLYTHQADRLLAGLLPKPPTPVAPEETAARLAQSCSPATLINHALRVHGLWSNVCALGIFDDKLWRVIDFSWALLMESLKLAKQSAAGVEDQ